MNRNLSFREAKEKIRFYNELILVYEFKHSNKETNFFEKYIEINNKIINYCNSLMPKMRDSHSQRKLDKFIEYIEHQNEMYKKIKQLS